jgi:hypothetical protein
MSFQYVIDNAQSISISKRKRVAQTVSRAGVVKATSVGGQVYEFRVQLPNGLYWTDNRGLIEAVEALDRTTVNSIRINKSAHSYISGYQGDIVAEVPAGITVSYSTGNTLTITNVPGDVSSGYRFKTGDFIQLGSSGSVYNIVSDVAHNDNTITVHRPIKESAGNYTLLVGRAVDWDVICVEMPTWTIFGYNQVSWSGAFVFVEAV